MIGWHLAALRSSWDWCLNVVSADDLRLTKYVSRVEVLNMIHAGLVGFFFNPTLKGFEFLPLNDAEYIMLRNRGRLGLTMMLHDNVKSLLRSIQHHSA
jgi:hypothetical protein